MRLPSPIVVTPSFAHGSVEVRGCSTGGVERSQTPVRIAGVRILHLPSNPADQAGIVVRALRSLGHDAELWRFGTSSFGFPADRIIDVEGKRVDAIWPHFIEAIERFDVFHFHLGASFFPTWERFPMHWDLPLLRALGKKIIFTFVGSDCRRREPHAAQNPYSDLFFAQYEPDEERILGSLAIIRHYADRLLAMSVELMPYVPGSTYIPRAFDLDAWPAQGAEQREVPVILHAPSRRSLKGTDLIVAGMEQLEREGIGFEFSFIEGVPHDELRKRVQDADIIIDNITMGDHGISSVEAMASDRVAVAYLIDPVKRACPGLPVFDVTPPSFVDRMRELVTDVALRRRLASAGRAYVSEHWDAKDVARRHLEIYAEPVRGAPGRSFPDWAATGGPRRIEALEDKVEKRGAEVQGLKRDVARLEVALGTAQQRLAAARRYSLTRLIPDSMRRTLRARRQR